MKIEDDSSSMKTMDSNLDAPTAVEDTTGNPMIGTVLEYAKKNLVLPA